MIASFRSVACAVAAGFTSAVLTPSGVQAYALYGVAWPSADVTLHLHFNEAGTPPPPSTSTSWNGPLQGAVVQWNTWLVRSKLAVVPDSDRSHGTGDQTNSVYFSKDFTDDHVLAYTAYRYQVTQMVEADIIFNANKTWSAYSGPLRGNADGSLQPDIRRVALHELGHLLGLDHPDEDKQVVIALMNSAIDDTDVLQPDDIEGAVELYGKVLSPPTLTAEPSAVSIDAGQPLSLSVSGTGEKVRYTWLVGSDMEGDFDYVVDGDGFWWSDSVYSVEHAQPEDSGYYAGIVANWAGYTVTTPVKVEVRPPAPDPLKRLVNLSTRGQAGTGADQLIAGFYVSGPKRLLVRAIGPSLGQPPHNVPGSLADVKLTIYRGVEIVASNDDWGTQTNADEIATVAGQRGAFALDRNSKDAALLLSLPAGPYTAQVSATGSATGVALVEVYEADDGPAGGYGSLVNLATRGYVGAGADRLIAGFYVTGSSPKQMVIRAIGPGLAEHGVEGYNTDTYLRLFNAAGKVVAYNDDWFYGKDGKVLLPLFPRVGASALSAESWDAALVVTLPPGLYTAMVEGTSGETGIGLVEVFEVPANP